MKFLIWLLILGALLWVGRQGHDAWLRVKKAPKDQTTVIRPGAAKSGETPAPAEGPLPGMPESLESGFQNAKSRGPTPLKQWLDQNRRLIRDPRLAAIELDYVVLIGTVNRGEARRVLNELAARLPSDSPVYDRFKKLHDSFR
ncbi:MAG: hypothetical protein FJ404_14510 [Verrucomicrobia bacterium]|nr:hypothetical protein [Verrucomicrobiota bacterium]